MQNPGTPVVKRRLSSKTQSTRIVRKRISFKKAEAEVSAGSGPAEELPRAAAEASKSGEEAEAETELKVPDPECGAAAGGRVLACAAWDAPLVGQRWAPIGETLCEANGHIHMAARGVEVHLAPEIASDEELQGLYNWVDEIPLSRPKKNISRDFQDGVLFAEMVHYFYPRIVEMHNYSAANSHTQKMYNWTTLNQKVLKKLGFQIHQQDLEDVIKAAPGAIERVLRLLQDKITQAQAGGLREKERKSVGGSRVSATPSEGGRASSGDDGASAGNGRLSSGAADGRRPQEQPGSRPRSDLGTPNPVAQKYQQEVDAELLVEKEQTIAELREMVVIMSEKIKKLEQLVRIKDSKIEAMNQKLQKYNLA